MRGSNWLDGLLYGVRRVFADSTELTASDALSFTGAGVSAIYDPATKRIVVEIPGAGGGAVSWAGMVTAAASASSDLEVGGGFGVLAETVSVGTTPATTIGQLRASPGEVIAAKIGPSGEDRVIVSTDDEHLLLGSTEGNVVAQITNGSTKFRVLDPAVLGDAAVSAEIGHDEIALRKLVKLYGGAATPATETGHVGLDSTGRLTVFADGVEQTIPVASDVSGGSGLQTGADIDYAVIGAGTPQDFVALGNGTYTIGGRAHVVANKDNAAKFGLDAAGLTGRATVNSGWPVIHLPLTTLAPAVSLVQHEVWILARLKLSAGTPGEGTLVRMSFDYEAWAGGDQATRFLYHQAGYQSGAHYLAIGAPGHEYNSFAVSSALVASDMVVAWRLSDAGRTVQFYALAWPGAWPSVDDLTQIASEHFRFSHYSNAWKPADATLRLSWVDATSTLAEWSMPRIQVLYR